MCQQRFILAGFISACSDGLCSTTRFSDRFARLGSYSLGAWDPVHKKHRESQHGVLLFAAVISHIFEGDVKCMGGCKVHINDNVTTARCSTSCSNFQVLRARHSAGPLLEKPLYLEWRHGI